MEVQVALPVIMDTVPLDLVVDMVVIMLLQVQVMAAHQIVIWSWLR